MVHAPGTGVAARHRRLRAGDERHGVLDCLPQACVVVAADGVVTRWNAAALDLFGYSPAAALAGVMPELTGSPRHVVRPSDGTFRVEAVRGDGTAVLVEVALGSRSAGSGARYALLRDVTEELASEQQTHERIAMWTRAFTISPMGMALVGLDGRFEPVNSALAEFLGYCRHELVGTPFASITHPDDVTGSVCDFRELLTGQTETVERLKRYRRADGQYRWARRTGSVLLGQDGSLRQVLVHIQDVTDEHTAQTRLAHLANTDELTGLGNREHLRSVADARTAACAILLLDLDDFKRINDSLGHAAGDRVLIEIAHRLDATRRPQDLVVRLGGDEFAVLVNDADERLALAECERIHDALTPLIAVAGAQVKVDVSIGATCDPTTGRALATLLREADLAMYSCKADGKRSSRLYRPAMLEQSCRHLQLEGELRQALRADRLHIAYQPIIELSQGRLVGVEALCRWTHPQLGMISPAEFIPLAEGSGLIDELTTWVLREATAAVAGWATQCPAAEGLSVSVNVACSTAQAPGFADHIRAILQGTGLAPNALILEVTETGVATSQQALLDSMWALSRLGVRFALDDFGTGYSSLARLAELPFTSLKLDRSFIAAITAVDDVAPLVDATVAMAAGLHLTMVAEGVETTAQLARLAAAGCDQVQGFLTGRPAADHEILTRLVSLGPAPGAPTHAAQTGRVARPRDRYPWRGEDDPVQPSQMHTAAWFVDRQR